MSQDRPFQIAIVGGGIAGATLALGLLSRKIEVKIYERGQSFREVGAGIGFTKNAERAMLALEPQIYHAFKKVAAQNADDWYYWVDGSDHTGDQEVNDLIHKMDLGKRGFEGCHRADFLDELVKSIPKEVVCFNKNLKSIVDGANGGKLTLNFADGTSEEADAVIGCDGVRSRVRQLILGEGHPAAYPGYSHKYAFRGLVPMDKAKAILGNDKAFSRHIHIGQDAHATTFPVAGGTLFNVVAFVTDPEDWPHKEKLTAPGQKAEAAAAFASFNPGIRAIIDLLPEKLDKWAIFDTCDNPAPVYANGRICISGDAAHATSPYHGAGAGFAIEDGLVLASLLKKAESTVQGSNTIISEAISAAFEAYSEVRLDRTHWLVEGSRYMGETYELQHERDPKKIRSEINWRSHHIWDYDVSAMVEEAYEKYEQKLKH